MISIKIPRIDLTIETLDDDILTVFDRIGKEAQEKGITEEKLAELLSDESSIEFKPQAFVN
jgi:hypothetical protein